MAASLDERHPPASPRQTRRRQRASEPRADDGDVHVDDTGNPLQTSIHFRVASSPRFAFRTVDCRAYALLDVHRVEPIAAGAETASTASELLQVPEIDEQPPATACFCERRLGALLDVRDRGWTEQCRFRQAFDR